MPALKEFHDIARDPIGYASNWKAEIQGRVVGYFCSYAPEEIIWAAGVLPYRILGSGGTISKADGHLQAYSCSLVRGALDDALTGKLNFLDGTVFPHTCDSIQRLSDIWRLNTGFDFHLDLVLPVKLNTQSAEVYMRAVIKKFRRDLEAKLDVKITEAKLKKAILTLNQIRSHLRRLYEFRTNFPDSISSSDLHAIVKASMVMDRDALSEKLSEIIACLDEHKPGIRSEKKRLVLTGGICNMPDIYREIEEAGGAVVWDDFCTGSRYFEGKVETQGNLLDSIGQRYFNRIICPAKHRDSFSRANAILKMAADTGAQGVVFVLLKFCDPHAFDYPHLKDVLDRAGISSLLLEIEDQQTSIAQLKTRLEAFIERL